MNCIVPIFTKHDWQINQMIYLKILIILLLLSSIHASSFLSIIPSPKIKTLDTPEERVKHCPYRGFSTFEFFKLYMQWLPTECHRTLNYFLKGCVPSLVLPRFAISGFKPSNYYRIPGKKFTNPQCCDLKKQNVFDLKKLNENLTKELDYYWRDIYHTTPEGYMSFFGVWKHQWGI